jgi:hypothetical protein
MVGEPFEDPKQHSIEELKDLGCVRGENCH